MKLFFRKSGSGRPMIILHGLFGISDNWATLARQWSEHYTVYAVDLRNHGQSPHAEDWNYRVMSEDVAELIRGEALRDVILIGHSMGGKTGMRLALDQPALISRLVVSDIAPKKYESNQRDVVEALLRVQPQNLASRKEAETLLAERISDYGTQQFLLKNLYWEETAAGKKLNWRFNLDVISRKLDVVSEATNEPAPCFTDTLFIRGERSDYITAEDETEISYVFPNSKIITVKNAGHWVHADQPQAVYDEVMRFAD
ncbi:MAG: alpha/beta hydrolase [Bacteroidetes bacterium]|nr:MAG: alpha/beta hydrolase [Bacteroidota bacterium]